MSDPPRVADLFTIDLDESTRAPQITLSEHLPPETDIFLRKHIFPQVQSCVRSTLRDEVLILVHNLLANAIVAGTMWWDPLFCRYVFDDHTALDLYVWWERNGP